MRRTLKAEKTVRKLAYLSGAPRVSTRPEAGASGPRSHVLGVIHAFKRLGWNVQTFIVGDRVPVSWVRGEQSVATLRRSWVHRAMADVIRLGMGWMNGYRAWREIGEVDLVYERYGAFQALGWWFKRQGIPWILETNGLISYEAAEDPISVGVTVAFRELLQSHERWAYQQCDLLVCVSQSLADLISQQMNLDPKKMIVIPNAVDTYHFDLSRTNPKRLFPGTTIGFVGGLYGVQRLDLLLEAIAELRKEGITYSLSVVGDGAMREKWEQIAKELEISNQVKFTGYIPWNEVPSYIAGFDIGYAGAGPRSNGFAYHSHLKLYEYAAMGKPFIAARYTDAESLIAHGVKGYLFEAGNLEDLKGALRKAFLERDCWSATTSRNRAVIVKQHSWETRISSLMRNLESYTVMMR